LFGGVCCVGGVCLFLFGLVGGGFEKKLKPPPSNTMKGKTGDPPATCKRICGKRRSIMCLAVSTTKEFLQLH